MNEEKKKYCRIDKWHEAGYTGKGVKIAVFEDFKGHGAMVKDVLKQVAPDADVLERPRPGGMIVGSKEHIRAMRDFYRSLVDEGVNIVEMSLSGTNTPELEQLQKDILLANNITMITSAGNRGSKGLTPAAKFDTWISVGACTLVKGRPKLTYYSSIGEELDICGFSNLYLSNGRWVQGTSFAAPWVAGMLALWFQWYKEKYGRYPTPKEALEFLKENAVDLEEKGHDPKTGYGLFVLPELDKLKPNKAQASDVAASEASSIKSEMNKSSIEEKAGMLFFEKGSRNVKLNINRLLRVGDRGPEVRELQSALHSIGYSPGPVDGIFGRLTRLAVMNFQFAHDLTVDGIVGPQTLGKLREVIK